MTGGFPKLASQSDNSARFADLTEEVFAKIVYRLSPPVPPVWTVYRWDIINEVIDAVRATRYLEIGVSVGHTFTKIRCREKTGVDLENPNALAGVLPMSSDEFFAQNRQRFDVVFVDALHSYEQSLADAVNALKCVDPGGFVILHDCNPSHRIAATRRMINGGAMWNGQVFNTANRLRLSEGVSVVTVNTDFGVALVRRSGDFELHTHYRPLAYGTFARNRARYLNLISPQLFKSWLAGVSLPRQTSA